MSKFSIPNKVPFMCLDGVFLIKNCVLPLHIFENRYREMLEFVLSGSRIFGISSSKFTLYDSSKCYSSIGIVQSCKTNDNGTSDLMLLGISKVLIKKVYFNKPYLQASIELISSIEDNFNVNKIINKKIKESINDNIKSDNIIKNLESLSCNDAKIDFAASIITDNTRLQKNIFNCVNISDKLKLFENI